MALARPIDPLEDFAGERRLALHVIRQAAADLDNAVQRPGAARFLLHALPGSVWHAWLDGELDLAAVRALVARKLARPPRPSGIKTRPDGVTTVVD